MFGCTLFVHVWGVLKKLASLRSAAVTPPKAGSSILLRTQQRCDKHTPGNKPTVIQAGN